MVAIPHQPIMQEGGVALVSLGCHSLSFWLSSAVHGGSFFFPLILYGQRNFSLDPIMFFVVVVVFTVVPRRRSDKRGRNGRKRSGGAASRKPRPRRASLKRARRPRRRRTTRQASAGVRGVGNRI